MLAGESLRAAANTVIGIKINRLLIYVLVLAVFVAPVLLGDNPKWNGDIASQSSRRISVAVEFPRVADIFVRPGRGTPAAVSFRIRVPSSGPENVKGAVFLKSKDGLWYQTLTKGPFAPGQWEDVAFTLFRHGGQVLPDDHFFALNGYTSTKMEIVGLKFFSTSQYSGSVDLKDVTVDVRPISSSPLRMLGLRQNAGRVEVLDLFEVTFRLSRSFANPFDPDEVRAEATFVSPSGKVYIVPAFCYRNFLRSRSEGGEILTPCGRQEWKVRFTPVEPGVQSFYLTAKTDKEEVRSSRGLFEAVPSRRKGFVEVCRSDPSWFQLTTGEFFYPVGHNVRSPTDPRCAKHIYGLKEPVDMGTFAYDRYVSKMAANGENLFEVWMSSWWLGLEWTKRWKTYYGLGHYSMENAWRLDYLLDLSDRSDMYMHLVIDNHGKASTWCDKEWRHNAYNVKNGGFLDGPEEFFSNDQAKKYHKKKLRYIVGRWGYSPRIMGFELWSEIDLTGESAQQFRRHPVKREWHREMIRYLNQIDPWRHLCTTHYSGNYHIIDPAMAAMPEIDYIAVDAYRDKGSVIPYILGTVDFGKRLQKPTIITEYGGNPWGFKSEEKLGMLKADLHAGIWSGFMSGLSGTPLFWWFDFIDKEDLYYHYKALAAFSKGEDLRGLGLEGIRADVQGVNGNKVRALALTNGKRAFLWVYHERVARIMPGEKEVEEFKNISIALPMDGEEYVIEFWDTYRGAIIDTVKAETDGGVLLVNVPSFKRDLACKIIPMSTSSREDKGTSSEEAVRKAPYE